VILVTFLGVNKQYEFGKNVDLYWALSTTTCQGNFEQLFIILYNKVKKSLIDCILIFKCLIGKFIILDSEDYTQPGIDRNYN
jgi:hypothetical protein